VFLSKKSIWESLQLGILVKMDDTKVRGQPEEMCGGTLEVACNGLAGYRLEEITMSVAHKLGCL